ncbi:MAG: phosphoenolpyruvate carboxykinase (ATP) [Alistipes finegoldii]
MDKMDLKKYGITGVTEIVYNPSYDELFREETKKGLRGYEKGQLTETGAVNVMTGVYTGRSPKDKFFVMDETTKDTIWWTSDEYKNDNKPVTKQPLEGAEEDRFAGAFGQETLSSLTRSAAPTRTRA